MIDVAIPNDSNIRNKNQNTKHEKLEKYQSPKEEGEKTWRVKTVPTGDRVSLPPKLDLHEYIYRCSQFSVTSQLAHVHCYACCGCTQSHAHQATDGAFNMQLSCRAGNAYAGHPKHLNVASKVCILAP